MTDCGCKVGEAKDAQQRRILRIALGLNATMFVVGIVAGIAAQSSGLIADALDMLADASAYAIALMAVQRSEIFKARAATLSGSLLLVLGLGVLLDAIRRGISGSEPEAFAMIVVATLSLCVNSFVLYLLNKQQEREDVHIRASFIFTRADVIANLSVILSAIALSLTHVRYIDWIVGAAIGVYVMREAWEILSDAKEAREAC